MESNGTRISFVRAFNRDTNVVVLTTGGRNAKSYQYRMYTGGSRWHKHVRGALVGSRERRYTTAVRVWTTVRTLPCSERDSP